MKNIMVSKGKKRVLTVLLVASVAILAFPMAVGATEWTGRALAVASQGKIMYDNPDGDDVVVDSDDLRQIATNIDTLEGSYKESTMNAVASIGQAENVASVDTATALQTNFNDIMASIRNSQSIPEQTIGASGSCATVDEEKYTLASTISGTTVNADTNITAATAENLSLGSAAWVDGQLVVGNGGDNNNYYEQSTTPIYISSIVLSASASANSVVSKGDGSSVGTNTTTAGSSGSSSFSISIKGYSKLSIQSGTCSYSLEDSSGIKSNASGTITGNDAIGIYGYDLLTLSYTTSAWKVSVGTHDSSASCSSSINITGIEIK